MENGLWERKNKKDLLHLTMFWEKWNELLQTAKGWSSSKDHAVYIDLEGGRLIELR